MVLKFDMEINSSSGFLNLHWATPKQKQFLLEVGDVLGPRHLQFLLQSLDTLHCREAGCRFVSSPSKTSEQSVTRVFPFEVDVTAPAAWSEENFDVVLTVFPFSNYIEFQEFERYGNSLLLESGSGFAYGGGINAYVVDVGAEFNWSSPVEAGTDASLLFQWNVPTDATGMKGKCIGGFLKYMDTTNKFVQTGFVHAAQIPDDPTKVPSTFIGSQSDFCYDAIVCNSYPSTVDEMRYLPGYKNSLSKDGFCMNLFCNPYFEARNADEVQYIFQGNSPLDGTINTANVIAPSLVSSVLTDATVKTPKLQPASSGMIAKTVRLSNLPGVYTNGSWTANFSGFLVYENQPSPNLPGQLTYLPFQENATPWDGRTLEILSEAMRLCPVYLDAKSNETGSWLRDVLDTLMPIAGEILSFVPHPIAQGLSLGAKVLDTARKSNRKTVSAWAPSDVEPHIVTKRKPKVKKPTVVVEEKSMTRNQRRRVNKKKRAEALVVKPPGK